jgi:hypothetical protein
MWPRYRPDVAQRVGRGIALLFHDLGTRRGWVVSSMSWPHVTPRKDLAPIVQEAGLGPGPVWTDTENLAPNGIRSPDRPARSQSLYHLSYPAHNFHPLEVLNINNLIKCCLISWSWWSCRVRCESAATSLLGLQVWIPLGAWLSCLVTVVFCQIKISVTDQSLAQRSHTEFVCHRVWSGATITLYTYSS